MELRKIVRDEIIFGQVVMVQYDSSVGEHYKALTTLDIW